MHSLRVKLPLPMREELNKNEDVIFDQQMQRVKDELPNQARRYVRAGGVVGWLLLALVALSLWLMRLMGAITLPW